MTITKVKAKSVFRLDADLYVEPSEMLEWARPSVRPGLVNPWGSATHLCLLEVLDGGGRDAGSEMFDSATQDALISLENALVACPFLIPRGRIAVAEVWGADMDEALKWSIDRPERSICLVCRET